MLLRIGLIFIMIFSPSAKSTSISKLMIPSSKIISGLASENKIGSIEPQLY